MGKNVAPCHPQPKCPPIVFFIVPSAVGIQNVVPSGNLQSVVEQIRLLSVLEVGRERANKDEADKRQLINDSGVNAGFLE